MITISSQTVFVEGKGSSIPGNSGNTVLLSWSDSALESRSHRWTGTEFIGTSIIIRLVPRERDPSLRREQRMLWTNAKRNSLKRSWLAIWSRWIVTGLEDSTGTISYEKENRNLWKRSWRILQFLNFLFLLFGILRMWFEAFNFLFKLFFLLNAIRRHRRSANCIYIEPTWFSLRSLQLIGCYVSKFSCAIGRERDW